MGIDFRLLNEIQEKVLAVYGGGTLAEEGEAAKNDNLYNLCAISLRSSLMKVHNC